MDWDTGNLYYTEQRLGADHGAALAGATADNAQQQFIEFILHFLADPNSYTFKYREQLARNVNAGHRVLEVELDDLQHFDELLAGALRLRPGDVLPQLEAAALQVVQRLRIGDEASAAAAADAADAPIQVTLTSSENAQHIRDLQASHLDKLTRVTGIVIATSRVKSKARAVTLICRGCSHKKVVPVRPGLGGFAVPRVCDRADRGECPLDPYLVLADESKFVDVQTVKLQELPETVPTGEVPRSLLLALDRALADRVTPGERVSAVGVFSTFSAGGPGRSSVGKSTTGSGGLMAAVRAPYLRVVGVRAAESRRDRHPTFTPAEEEEMLRISRLPDLYGLLARSIAPEIWGLEDQKRAVLCQLFGGSRKHLPDGMRLRGDINALLLGDPSTAKSQLLKFVEKVAPISVYTSGKGSSAAGLTASVIRDASSGEFHLEGGAMVLADGGVVCIDEFDKMRLADRVAIHEAMEQQTISIAKAGITTVLNSRAAVLAAANPMFGSFDDSKHTGEQIDFASTILSRFDLIFVVRDIRNDARDRVIAKHVLGLHQRGNSARVGEHDRALSPQLAGADAPPPADQPDIVAIDKLRQYVTYARRHCAPRLAPETADLLRSAYVDIRQDVHHSSANAEDAPAPVPITVRQLESLVRLSESLARMRLSPVANSDDVEEALRLFRVSTMAASRSGVLPAMEGAMSGEFLVEVNAAEAAIKRRLAVGFSLAERRLVQELRQQLLSDSAVTKALQVMMGRRELEWRKQRTAVHRVR